MPFDKTSHNYQIGRDAGIYAGLSYVINLLNTYDTDLINKKDLYNKLLKTSPNDVNKPLEE